MVTTTQPQLWSWLQQPDTIKNTPNTPKILVHCRNFHSCLNSGSCPENMCPNLCHGLAGSHVPPWCRRQVASNSRRICGPTTTSCLTTCALTEKHAVMLEQDGATWSMTQPPLQRWCSQNIWSPTKFTIWSPASPKQARLSWMVDAAGEHYSGGASQVSSVSLCSWRTLAWNQQLKQQQQYHQAHPWHHHFFGRTQPSVHCLIGHGGAAEKKKTVEQVANKKNPKQDSVVQKTTRPIQISQKVTRQMLWTAAQK